MSFDLYAEIEKVASEQFATEVEREAFKEAFFEKSASLFSNVVTAADKAPELYKSMAKGIGMLGVGIAGASLAYGVAKGAKTIESSSNRRKFETALANVLANNRIVKASPDRAKQYAETIYKFGPNVAGDVNLLGSILANVVQGEGVDPMTIKTIVDLEGRYQDNNTINLPRFG